MSRVGTLPTLFATVAVLAAVLLPLSLIAMGASSATAADAHFVVDSELDAVDVVPGDGECLTAEGECTLRAAVMEANALAGLDTVEVPTGTYAVSIAAESHDPPGGGDIDITDDLAVFGMGPDSTVVKGPGGVDQWSVFDVAEGVSVTLAMLQVREGSGDSGGGIENSGTLSLRHASVVSNTSSFGGGIRSGGDLRLSDTLVVSNTGDFGGGIVSEGELVLSGSSVLSNTAAFGGGIRASGPAHVADSLIEGNEASHGGGIQLDSYPMAATVSIERTVIRANKPAGIECPGTGTVLLTDSEVTSNGIGIDLNDAALVAVGSRVVENKSSGIGAHGGVATVSDSEVSRNGEGGGMAGSDATLRVLASKLEANEGSAIADRNKGEVVVASSSIVSNTGSFGGGVSMSNQGTLTLVDCTVAGNGAAHGGGIYVGNGGEHYVLNSTISGNHASIGDNIRNGGDLTLENTTVWTTVGEGRGLGINNSRTISLMSSVLGAVPPAISCAPSTTGEMVSGGHNVSSDDSCELDADLDDLEEVEPLLGPLADNGGRTSTHALLESSPAIDHGAEFGCPDTDQRGVIRPQGEGCDSGAYEYGAEAPPVPTPSRDFEITDVRVFGYARSSPDGEMPVVGATVTVQAMPGRCTSPVVTDENGAFETTCQEAHLLGAVSVVIRAEDYESWRNMYMLGPFGEERGPVAVAALLTWDGGPTPTPGPEPTNTPEPVFELHVPVASR